MNTNNNIANYIARKGIAKHMSREAARAIWRDLIQDGWKAEGFTLVKVDTEAHRFVFERLHGDKMAVRYCTSDWLKNVNADLETIPLDDPRHMEIMEKLGLEVPA